jgi:hypothetical protein
MMYCPCGVNELELNVPSELSRVVVNVSGRMSMLVGTPAGKYSLGSASSADMSVAARCADSASGNRSTACTMDLSAFLSL